MQAVGQLDQDDPDIVDHGQQHLADAFGLALLARGQVQLAQFGDAIHAAGHLIPKLLADLFERCRGVFDDVVEQAGLQADHVHVHVGQQAGNQQRMRHVGLARNPLLALVALRGEAIGTCQGCKILFGSGFPQARFEAAIEGFDRGRTGSGAGRSYRQRGTGRNGISGFP